MFKKSKEPSNLTKYDWKMLFALVFCSMSLSISSQPVLFGLYYLEQIYKIPRLYEAKREAICRFKRDIKRLRFSELKA